MPALNVTGTVPLNYIQNSSFPRFAGECGPDALRPGSDAACLKHSHAKHGSEIRPASVAGRTKLGVRLSPRHGGHAKALSALQPTTHIFEFSGRGWRAESEAVPMPWCGCH
jgi:hypothetical protein